MRSPWLTKRGLPHILIGCITNGALQSEFSQLGQADVAEKAAAVEGYPARGRVFWPTERPIAAASHPACSRPVLDAFARRTRPWPVQNRHEAEPHDRYPV